MQASTYLHFDGKCEEAFKFYERVMGAKVEGLMRFEGSPAEQQVPAEKRKEVLHARLRIGDTIVMGGDAPPGHFRPMQGFDVSLQVSTPAEAERVFAALCDGGTVVVPMAQSFFAQRFGMVTDRFGTPWIVLCENPS